MTTFEETFKRWKAIGILESVHQTRQLGLAKLLESQRLYNQERSEIVMPPSFKRISIPLAVRVFAGMKTQSSGSLTPLKNWHIFDRINLSYEGMLTEGLDGSYHTNLDREVHSLSLLAQKVLSMFPQRVKKVHCFDLTPMENLGPRYLKMNYA